jgi:MFS family permease
MGFAEQVLGGPVTPQIAWFFVVCSSQALGWAIFGIQSTFFAMDIGVTAFGLGVSWALNETAQLVAAPLLGRFSDALGRKPILVCSFTWCATVVGCTAFVTTAMAYILARAISGLGQPVQSLLAAVLTDIIEEKERSQRFGSFMAVPFMTFVLGSGIGSLLIVIGLEIWQAILVSCIVLYVSAIIAAFKMPETLPRSKRKPLCGVGGSGTGELASSRGESERVHALLNVGLLLVWFSRATSSLAIVGWMLTYPFLIKDAFGWGPTEFGFIMMMFFLVVGCSQNMLFPLMDKKFGSHVTAGLGQLTLVPALCLLPVTVENEFDYGTRIILHGAVMLVGALALAVVEVSIPRIVSAYVPEPGLMGLAQGGTASFKSIGFIMGSLVGGSLYDSFGIYGPYLLGGALALIGTSAVAGAYYLGEVSESSPETANSKQTSPLTSKGGTPRGNSTPPRTRENYYATASNQQQP